MNKILKADNFASHLKNTKLYFQSALSLPIFYDLSTQKVLYIGKILCQLIKKYKK